MKQKKERLKKQNQKMKIPLPLELINGQSMGAVSGMKFGLGTIRNCGCEVIAVYNALLLSGVPHPFEEVAKYMVRFSMLGGLWGTFPYALGHCLRHFGLENKKLRTRESVKRELAAGNRVVYTYWNGRRFLSSIHTVCVEQRGEKLYVCNEYSNVTHPTETTPDAYFCQNMITAYQVVLPTLSQ